MRTDKFMMAKAWMKQDQAPQSEARDTWNMMEAEFNDERKATLMANAESDRIKAMMNEQYGPGTVKYGSEIPQPEIKTPQAAFEFSQRHPAANGGFLDEALVRYDKYLKMRDWTHQKGTKKTKVIPFKAFFENFATENRAEGGRIGFYTGTDPELMKLYKELVEKQGKSSLTKIGWNREKLLNLSNYLNNSEKTLDEYLEMSPSKKNKINKAKLTGVGKGAGQIETETTQKFRKWLAKQDPKTLKADSVQDLIRQAKIKGVYMDKGSVKGIPREKIISIVRENPQFENVTIRNWNEMDKVSDTVFTRSYEPDNPKYSGVYETTSKTGNKTYYGIVQRNKDTIKKFFPTPEEAADFVTEERKNPTSQELAGEKKIEERDFPNRKTPSKKRIDALKENSSYGFEKATTGDLKSNTVGGHTGSIYAETQTPKTKKYTDSRINAALESYDNALSAITKKRDAALKAGDFAEVERLNQKGMNYAAATEGYKTFTVKNMDGTSFLSGSTSKGAVDFMDLMDPNITAKDITNFGTAYRGQNVPVNKAKFELKNALEKYGKNSKEVKAAKQNLMDINAVEQEKLFSEGTNKSLLEAQKDSGMKSSKLTKLEVEATIERIQSNFEDLRKNPEKSITDKKIDYIGGKKDFVGVNSGFNTDLLMKDPLVQKIMNSTAGKKTAGLLRGATGAAGKVFGIADIVIGVLDYENNISKGQSSAEALKNATQAMSFGLWRGGDRARTEEVKKFFVKNGGDGKIFDQVTALNTKDQELNDLIYKSKNTADRAFMNYSKTLGLGETMDRRKKDYTILKKQLNEEIASKVEERDNMIKSYKTNLRVSEAGAPIQIGDKDFFSKPFKDTKRATMDKIESENKKAYDMQKRQVNYTSGKIGNWLENNLFAVDSPKYVAQQKLINEMDERELYKFNLQRGMDPDNLIRIEDILRYKQTSPDVMGANITKYIKYADRKPKAEGGIMSLTKKNND